MIFVQGWIKVAAEDIEKAIPAMAAMADATRTEAGCHDYSFARDIIEPNIIRLNEHWASEADLDAHFQTPHMADFNAAIADLTIEAVDVRMYSGDEVRVIMQS